MSNDRKKKLITSPLGTVQWFSLSKVDKFGSYTCNLVFEDSPEVHKFISEVTEFCEAEKVPFKKTDDGKPVLKLKLKSQGQKKDGSTYEINPPAIYNVHGERLSGADLALLNVGNGSEMRAKIEFAHWTYAGNTGISVKPISVQLGKVIQFDGGGIDTGFDALELTETDEVPENDEEKSNYDF